MRVRLITHGLIGAWLMALISAVTDTALLHQCGSGVHHQLRRCLGRRCIGRSVNYQICNTHECASDAVDFRQSQCAFYNGRPYRGHIFDEWTAVYTPDDACALLCMSAKYKYIVRMAPKVADGTACASQHNHTQHICVNGKCLVVGCDQVVGSGAVPDSCGVCGGDGRSCGRSKFTWHNTKLWSACDKTCGYNRWQVTVSQCTLTESGKATKEKFCADQPRPTPLIRRCPDSICPEEWVVGQWEDCNVTCGGGWQWRQVYCAQKYNTSDGQPENIKVPEKFCWQAKKPESGRPCAQQTCPSWETGDWSTCSATCGKGTKTRQVECRQARYNELGRTACNPADRPAKELVCYTGVDCAQAKQAYIDNHIKATADDDDRQRFVAAAPFSGSSWQSVGQNYAMAPTGMSAGMQSANPHWMPAQWSQCSVSCGPGVRTRHLQCVAFQPLSGGVLQLPDYECEDSAKPVTFEPCKSRECATTTWAPDKMSSAMTSSVAHEYRWQYGDWTECSASCLGGSQRSTLECVDIASRKSVAWSYCDPRQRPVDLVRKCNSKQCPPRWDLGKWSVCGRTCGGSTRTRRVRCIREIARNTGADGTLVLPNSMCNDQPQPRQTEPCGAIDCPATWKIDSWSACSRSCGSGDQHRRVTCERMRADGSVQQSAPSADCAPSLRPAALQLCNMGDCGTLSKQLSVPQPLVNTSPNPLTSSKLPLGQSLPKDTNGKTKPSKGGTRKTLTLRTGASAKLFEGMSVKVKCPAPKFDRVKIRWMKDGQIIENSAHVKVSNRGALRIHRARKQDAGTYVCLTNGVQGNVTLDFKARVTDHRPSKPDTNRLSHQQAHPTQNMPKHLTDTADDDASVSVDSGSDYNYDDQSNLPNDRNSFKSSTTSEKIAKLKSTEQMVQRLGDYFSREGNRDMQLAMQSGADVKVHWMKAAWSPCSKTCGVVDGMQVRQVRCQVSSDKNEAYVDKNFCEELAKSKPAETRLCNLQPCPDWKTSDWTSCLDARCVSYKNAVMRRQADCVFPNQTVVGKEYCNRKTRPSLKQKCFNKNCVGEWRSEPYGACSHTCGVGGVQMRVISCVWHGTRKPAGASCESSNKPVHQRSCDPVLPPCADPAPITDLANCTNQSKFCSQVALWRLCQQPEFERVCCVSCTYRQLHPILPAGNHRRPL